MDKSQDIHNATNDSGGHIMKYIALFGGIQSASLLIGLIINKTASELLGRVGVGVIAVYNRTTRMLSDCTNLSLSFSAVRQISEIYNSGDEEQLRYWIKVLRSWAFITAVAGVLLTVVLCAFAGGWMFDGHEYGGWHVALLAMTVGSMAISGSELAIMKGVQQLNNVAACSFLAVFMALIFSVPLYIFVGMSGILPSVFLVAFSQMVVYLYYSLPKYAYKIDVFSLSVLRDGLGMIRLGVGYIFAAILGSGSIWLVYKMLNEWGNDDIVGLFSCGYFMMGVLPGVLFASIDSEFYPRLSAVNRDNAVANGIVNKQIGIQVLLQTPLLLCFVVLIPTFLPLFYDDGFIEAIPMIQTAMIGMFMRTMTMPVAYISLSKGDSRTYLLQESLYDIFFVIFVAVGFRIDGLCGVGWAVTLAYLLDMLVVYAIAAVKYKFRYISENIKYFLCQSVVMVSAVVAALYFKSGIYYWLVGLICIACSSLLSFAMLRHQIEVLAKIKKRLKKLVLRR